jgi:hypothetical protein
MYKDKFVLSIIHDGYPVKETGHFSSREVAIPFGSEYKIRLKNKNDRSCTARVFIDGRRVSNKGDFVIYAGGSVDLERFVDRSLTEGKKFKFVSLDHPDVDDPTSGENGLIKVEFRLAKQPNGIKIVPFYWEHGDTNADGARWDNGGIKWFNMDDSRSLKSKGLSDNISYTCNYVNCSTSVEQGATVEGGQSNQSFGTVDLDVEDFPSVILTLKIVGLPKTRAVEVSDGKPHKFCSHCGNRLKRDARYCSECGRRV